MALHALIRGKRLDGVELAAQRCLVKLSMNESMTQSAQHGAAGAHLTGREPAAKPALAMIAPWNQVMELQRRRATAEFALLGGLGFRHSPIMPAWHDPRPC